MATRVMLFDLGGVLADLGDPVAAMELDMESDAFWRTWTRSPSVRAFETGRMSERDFFEAIARELGYRGRVPFERAFARWVLRPFPGIEAFVRQRERGRQLALLSNTNPIHWRQVTAATTVFDGFRQTFLSFETGLFKPDPDAFLQVIEHFGCRPADIRFLDDVQANVDAARALGIDAHRYCAR